MTRSRLRAALACLAASLACTAAQAQLFRAYVAPTGLDTNPCTLAQPCRLLPAALTAVASGGEIWMLDSANYNTATVVVNKSVTILAVPGAVGSVVATGGPAISVTAGKVTLRNLVIVPLPGGGATHGVHMTGGTGLTIDKCTISNMPQWGVAVQAAAVVRVSDTAIRDSGVSGLVLADVVGATVTRTIVSGSAEFGIFAVVQVAGSSVVDVSDVTLDGNVVAGFRAFVAIAGGVLRTYVRSSSISRSGAGLQALAGAGFVSLAASGNIVGGAGIGIQANSLGSYVVAGGNTVVGNEIGMENAGGLFDSAGNNTVAGNSGGDLVGTISAVGTQ